MELDGQVDTVGKEVEMNPQQVLEPRGVSLCKGGRGGKSTGL